MNLKAEAAESAISLLFVDIICVLFVDTICLLFVDIISSILSNEFSVKVSKKN